jgi:hypothetical protein
MFSINNIPHVIPCQALSSKSPAAKAYHQQRISEALPQDARAMKTLH